jgi:hypothetical protein
MLWTGKEEVASMGIVGRRDKPHCSPDCNNVEKLEISGNLDGQADN